MRVAAAGSAQGREAKNSDAHLLAQGSGGDDPSRARCSICDSPQNNETRCGRAAARTEVVRMITEKTSAGAEAVAILTMGGSGQKVIRRYTTHLRSNKRRLTR